MPCVRGIERKHILFPALREARGKVLKSIGMALVGLIVCLGEQTALREGPERDLGRIVSPS